MTFLKSFIKNIVIAMGSIAGVGEFAGFLDVVQAFVQAYPILVVLIFGFYGLYTYVVWDMDRERRRHKYSDSLKGMSRRKRHKRRHR